MGFEDRPEDSEQWFPCECGGNISKNEDGDWECDTCDFCKEDQNDAQKNRGDRK